MAKKAPDPDDIYKFLGFEISPGKLKEFWKSDDEKKQYIKGVQARGGATSVLDRETALTNINLMTGVDKIVSIIGALFLIAGFFFPVYSFGTEANHISGNAISYFLNIPFIGGYALYGGVLMILVAVVYGLFIVACPVAGVFNILGVINKSKGDIYLDTVKKYSKFNYIPILLLLLLFMLLVLSSAHPFGSLGIESMGEILSVMALFSMTGIGFWLFIIGILFGFAQSRGL
jgi:hypothetical protein